MIINAAVEAENKTIKIKEAVQPESRIRNPRKFMGMLGGNPSIHMTGLISIFQYGDNNYMLVGALY